MMDHYSKSQSHKHKNNNLLGRVRIYLTKLKILTAIILDLIDLLICWIPLVNTLWDIVTFAVLFAILKDKRLAYLSLGELIAPGLGVLGLIDGFIPSATILVIIDILKDTGLCQ